MYIFFYLYFICECHMMSLFIHCFTIVKVIRQLWCILKKCVMSGQGRNFLLRMRMKNLRGSDENGKSYFDIIIENLYFHKVCFAAQPSWNVHYLCFFFTSILAKYIKQLIPYSQSRRLKKINKEKERRHYSRNKQF